MICLLQRDLQPIHIFSSFFVLSLFSIQLSYNNICNQYCQKLLRIPYKMEHLQRVCLPGTTKVQRKVLIMFKNLDLQGTDRKAQGTGCGSMLSETTGEVFFSA